MINLNLDPRHRAACADCDKRAFGFKGKRPACLRHLFDRAPRWTVRSATMRGTRHG